MTKITTFFRVRYHFEMKALSEGYVSFGLSRDAKMGEDLTTNCIVQVAHDLSLIQPLVVRGKEFETYLNMLTR